MLLVSAADASARRVTAMDRSPQYLPFDLPASYRIRVQGRLSASYSVRLDVMVITARQPASQLPVSTLTGEMRDQAALLGVLNTLFDLGLTLLNVERLSALPRADDPNP